MQHPERVLADLTERAGVFVYIELNMMHEDLIIELLRVGSHGL